MSCAWQPATICCCSTACPGEWLAEVTDAARKRVTLAIREATRPQEEAPDLWLASAPIKKGRVDWLVEKAVELGVARLVPVITQRTIVDKLNLDRHAQPYDRGRRAMRAHRAADDRRAGEAGCVPARLATGPRAALRRRDGGGQRCKRCVAPGPAAILIGPEGGFTPEERAAIRAAAAARRRSALARASCAPRPPRWRRSPRGWRRPGTGA